MRCTFSMIIIILCLHGLHDACLVPDLIFCYTIFMGKLELFHKCQVWQIRPSPRLKIRNLGPDRVNTPIRINKWIILITEKIFLIFQSDFRRWNKFYDRRRGEFFAFQYLLSFIKMLSHLMHHLKERPNGLFRPKKIQILKSILT